MGTVSDYVSIVTNLGVIGVLTVGIYMFMSGSIVPRSILDLILKVADERTAKVADEISLAIEKAVSRGIVSGLGQVKDILDKSETKQ